MSNQPQPQRSELERLQHVTIEVGTDVRVFSNTYATPLKIYVKDMLIYDSKLHPENDTTLPPMMSEQRIDYSSDHCPRCGGARQTLPCPVCNPQPLHDQLLATQAAIAEAKFAQLGTEAHNALQNVNLSALDKHDAEVRKPLVEVLVKVQQDINWMLNNRQFLNGDVFNYIEDALAKYGTA